MLFRSIKRVRGLTEVDLGKPSQATLTEISEDPITLCDVLYAVCKPQVDAAGLTDEDFGRGLAGDVIGEATTALLEELANFTRNPQRRELMRRAWQRLERLQQVQTEAMMRTLATLESPEIEQRIMAEAEADLTPLRSAISSAASSELTPDP